MGGGLPSPESPLLSIGQGQKGLRSHFDVISGGPWLEEGTGGEGYPPTTVPLKIEVVEGFKIGGRPPPHLDRISIEFP